MQKVLTVGLRFLRSSKYPIVKKTVNNIIKIIFVFNGENCKKKMSINKIKIKQTKIKNPFTSETGF